MSDLRPRLRKILVPTDLSASSRHAIDQAVRLARLDRGEILLLFVEGLFTYGVTGDLLGSQAAIRYFEGHRRAARAALLRQKKRVDRQGVRCRAIFVTGIPYEEIVRTARRAHADLIVMATHGRRGLTRAVMGSVAEKVVRIAPCPVLTLRGRARAGAARVAA